MGHIKVDKGIFLSQIRLKDVEQLVMYLNDKEIYNNTLTVPFPYTKADGEYFVQLCEKKKRKYGKNINWAIRDKNKKLIGGCSFHMKYPRNSRKDEIGYWLARPYWNKGIMTKVVNKLCEIGFTKFKLKKIEATVFIHNNASCRVLDKAGFQLKGVFRKSIKKGNKFVNVKLFLKEKN